MTSPSENPQSADTAKEQEEVHIDIYCDSCQMDPIIGERYKCDECDDYDLCGSCMDDGAHPDHSMTRKRGVRLCSFGHLEHRAHEK